MYKSVAYRIEFASGLYQVLELALVLVMIEMQMQRVPGRASLENVVD